MRKTVNMILVGLAVAFVNCGFLCEQARTQNPIVGDIDFSGSPTPGASILGPRVVFLSNTPGQPLPEPVISPAPGIPLEPPPPFNAFPSRGNGSPAALVAPDEPLW